MEDASYLDREEKFGRVASLLYSYAAPLVRDFDFVSFDVLSFRLRSVLDAGCGSGDVLAKKVHLALGSSRRIPFSCSFDVTYSSLSFHYWKDRNLSLPAKMRRLLAVSSRPVFRSQ